MSSIQGKFPSGVERSFRLTLEAMEKILGARQVQRIPRRLGLPSFLWRGGLLPLRLDRLRPILFLSPVAALPPRAPCPMVATVHEIPEQRPGAGEPTLRLLRNRRARHKLLPRAWRILVPSEQTKTALLSELPDLRGRIRVFAQPIDPRFLSTKGRERPRRERSGIVFVGVPRRRKNLPRLLEAWSRLPDALRKKNALHLVGPASLERFLPPKQQNQTHNFRFHRDLSTQALIALLDRSLGLALPSLSEGFGIPAFEAAARGIPCLCSENSPMTEWLGDLPLAVDPYDSGSIEKGLLRLLEDSTLWDKASREGPLRARAFAPGRSAQSWLSLLREAASL